MSENAEEFTAYVTHLQAEHRRLRQFLRRIELRWMQGAASEGGVGRLAEDLASLRAQLVHHFEHEESGGMLEEAVSRQPSLSREAVRLESEHPALLRAADELADRLKVASTTGSERDLREEFRCFAERLAAHEDAESRILADSFGVGLD